MKHEYLVCDITGKEIIKPASVSAKNKLDFYFLDWYYFPERLDTDFSSLEDIDIDSKVITPNVVKRLKQIDSHFCNVMSKEIRNVILKKRNIKYNTITDEFPGEDTLCQCQLCGVFIKEKDNLIKSSNPLFKNELQPTEFVTACSTPFFTTDWGSDKTGYWSTICNECLDEFGLDSENEDAEQCFDVFIKHLIDNTPKLSKIVDINLKKVDKILHFKHAKEVKA